VRSSDDEDVSYRNFPENHRYSDVRKGVSGVFPRKLENHLREKNVIVNYTSRSYLPIPTTYSRAETLAPSAIPGKIHVPLVIEQPFKFWFSVQKVESWRKNRSLRSACYVVSVTNLKGRAAR